MPRLNNRHPPPFSAILFLLLFALAPASALPLPSARQVPDTSPPSNAPSELGLVPIQISFTDISLGTERVLEFIPGQDVTTSSHVLIDFTSSVPVDASQPDILLTASFGSSPPDATVADDDTDGDNDNTCSRWQPCLPDEADKTAFLTHATRASVLLVDVPSDAEVYVRVRNFDRGRGVSSTLTGTLRIQRETSRPVCGGLDLSGGACGGNGRCSDSGDLGDALGTCECERGWGGRFCDRRVESAPATVARPSPLPDAPLGLPEAASVSVSAGAGRLLRWDVRSGRGKVLIWARVQRGTVVRADGKTVRVGGGGPGAGLYARGGAVPTETEEDRVGLRETARGDGERDTYEFVRVSEWGSGSWYLWFQGNATVGDDGEVLYSVKVGRCGGGGGQRDCPFEEEEGGFPTGIVIAVGVVAGVVVLAVVVGFLVVKGVRGVRGRRDKEESEGGGSAWADVRTVGSGRSGSKAEREEWRRKEERLKRGVGDLDCSTSASSPGSTPGRR